MRVAMIGAGTMGAGMARSLAREGHDVMVWNRTRSRAEALAGERIDVAGTVAEAVTAANVAITILYDLDSVLSVSEELVDTLDTDAVWLQSSTIGPQGIARLVDAVPGSAMLDAPMLGTKVPAEQGNLVPLVSGPRALQDLAAPVLAAVGTKTVDAGDRLGQASALKLACNAWVASLTAATAQSIAMCSALGVDPALFLQAIDGGPTGAPYAQLKGGMMLKGDYSPSFELDGLVKDVDLMRSAASDAGFPTVLLDALREVNTEASQAGHGDDDIAAVRFAFPG